MAALDRSQGMLLAVPFVLYLLGGIGRVGVRRFLVNAAVLSFSFLLPVLGYCWWYNQARARSK